MTISVSSMFIPVHDADEALAFYRDGLGLEVRRDVTNGGHRWVTVGAPGQPVDVVLFPPHGGRSQDEGDTVLRLTTLGSFQAAIFTTADLDATFDRLVSAGVEVIDEPEDRFWGVRDGAVRDPSGNLVRIAQA